MKLIMIEYGTIKQRCFRVMKALRLTLRLFQGQLLEANRVGRDGDKRIVPIAWAVGRDGDNWDWFVRLLSRNLGLDDGRNVAIISDKQSGLVKAICNILPECEHRQCAKHIMETGKDTVMTENYNVCFGRLQGATL